MKFQTLNVITSNTAVAVINVENVAFSFILKFMVINIIHKDRFIIQNDRWSDRNTRHAFENS